MLMGNTKISIVVAIVLVGSLFVDVTTAYRNITVNRYTWRSCDGDVIESTVYEVNRCYQSGPSTSLRYTLSDDDLYVRKYSLDSVCSGAAGGESILFLSTLYSCLNDASQSVKYMNYSSDEITGPKAYFFDYFDDACTYYSGEHVYELNECQKYASNSTSLYDIDTGDIQFNVFDNTICAHGDGTIMSPNVCAVVGHGRILRYYIPNTLCFVATAAFASPDHVVVSELRAFRDSVLIRHFTGRVFISVYNFIGPYLAVVIARSEILKFIVRKILVVFVAGIHFGWLPLVIVTFSVCFLVAKVAF